MINKKPDEPDDAAYRNLDQFLEAGRQDGQALVAPRAAASAGLLVDAPWRLEALRRAWKAGVRIVMVHVGDPDVWWTHTYQDTAKFGTKAGPVRAVPADRRAVPGVRLDRGPHGGRPGAPGPPGSDARTLPEPALRHQRDEVAGARGVAAGRGDSVADLPAPDAIPVRFRPGHPARTHARALRQPILVSANAVGKHLGRARARSPTRTTRPAEGDAPTPDFAGHRACRRTCFGESTWRTLGKLLGLGGVRKRVCRSGTVPLSCR